MWSDEFKVAASLTSFITVIDQFLGISQKAEAEKMNIFTILAILQFVSGDLIGWNRARNTVYKARINGRKSNLTSLMDQYIQEKIMKRKQQQPKTNNIRTQNFYSFCKRDLKKMSYFGLRTPAVQRGRPVVPTMYRSSK